MSYSVDQLKKGIDQNIQLDIPSSSQVSFASALSQKEIDKAAESFNNTQYQAAIDQIMRSMGAGGYGNRLEAFMAGIDRYQRNIPQTNTEHVGLTFITRPRLCLSAPNLLADRRFAALNTTEASMSHAIRCYLDTKFSKAISEGAANTPLVNSNSPWFTPLMNGLVGISGWPDPVLQTETTSTGFFSEDQTFAIGYDELNKTYDLSLTFKDPQNGPLAAIFYYWILYMHNLCRGIQVAYMDDVTYQRLNYTVSIYRFRLDPTRRYITGYAKATGCFPKSVPLGAMFNFGEGDLFAPEVGKFTIPFVANKIEYNDYAIFLDFNRLATRYWSDIDTPGKFIELGDSATGNFSGVPFVSTKQEVVDSLAYDGKSIITQDGFNDGVYHSGGRPRLAFRVSSNGNTQIPEV